MHPRLAGLYDEVIQRAKGWDARAALRELEALQWAPAEEVHNHRTRKLAALLVHCAENVPFYREELAARGIDPRDIKDERDLPALPRIDKDRLRQGYDRFFARGGGPPYDVWSTSGSTGSPFAFRLDKASIAANTFAALARGKRWWGAERGAPEAMIWSGARDTSGRLGGRVQAWKRRLAWGLKNITLVDTYTLDEATIREGYARMRRAQPLSMRAISSGLYRFCAGLHELGLDGRALGLRFVIYTGEALPSGQRAFVEEVLGCSTVCEYGCSELGILAFECPQGGLHLSHENLVFEFVREGRPAGPGEPAELLATNLNGFAAPLVRYAVGDVVVPSEAVCACGRTMPLLESVSGRSHDAIPDGQGGVVHGLFFTHLFDDAPCVHQFRVVQERLDHLRLELRSTVPIPESVRAQIRARAAKAFASGTRIDVEQVDRFPLGPNGKLRWIESKVKSEP